MVWDNGKLGPDVLITPNLVQSVMARLSASTTRQTLIQIKTTQQKVKLQLFLVRSKSDQMTMGFRPQTETSVYLVCDIEKPNLIQFYLMLTSSRF